MSFPGTGRRRRKSAAADVNLRTGRRRVLRQGPTRDDVWMRRDSGGIDERFAGYVRTRGSTEPLAVRVELEAIAFRDGLKGT